MIVNEDIFTKILYIITKRKGVADLFADLELKKISEIIFSGFESSVSNSKTDPTKDGVQWLNNLKSSVSVEIDEMGNTEGLISLSEILDLEAVLKMAYDIEFKSDEFINNA